MIRKIILNIFCLFAIVCSFAQKLPVDTSVLRKWPSLYSVSISNSGNYVYYYIRNQPIGKSTLVIQSTNNLWKKEMIGYTALFFTYDSKKIILKNDDTLYYLLPGIAGQSYIASNVNSCKKPKYGNAEWIAYQLKNPDKELILLNLLTGKEQKFKNVKDYFFDDNANELLLKTGSKQNNAADFSFQWINLCELRMDTIWSAL